MEFWQQTFIACFAVFNFLIFLKGLYEIKKRNPYGLTKYLFFIGAFVWGDMFVLGPFWIISSAISLLLNNWYLFLLFVSLFWVIRSLGETIYWLNEQFAFKNRNPPQTLNFHKLINGEAIWFIYQLFWQCIFVISTVFSVYFINRWLQTL
ncbi:MAG: hypothetical protein A3B38_03825 [Candidatus Levybacteria bacterium RIFCSPLOWO2_01_FULL_36_13]|nr:MAG: hypothetical protein A2684_00760 [Candidatus Levybacteria bacterium RIFCSPHIGHO2_01_FULL_36_15b]OGH34260.1 MAG: hypothetical protein A3B38_03825 [Candidatus Levybacteria bacterium RIFCSPLOWO2_01_FULL_36_13]